MSTIKIKKVETRKDLERFIDFHYDLYKDNEYDVPTLFSDDLNTLSKDKNAAFEFSEPSISWRSTDVGAWWAAWQP